MSFNSMAIAAAFGKNLGIAGWHYVVPLSGLPKSAPSFKVCSASREAVSWFSAMRRLKVRQQGRRKSQQ
jgi:hypothetical protein